MSEIEEKFSSYIYPVRVTEKEKEKHVNLLVVQTKQHLETETKHHFLAIKDFERLIVRLAAAKKHKKFVCYRCFQMFYPEPDEKKRSDCKELKEHLSFCQTVRIQRVQYPTKPEDKIMKFNSVAKQLHAPFVA